LDCVAYTASEGKSWCLFAACKVSDAACCTDQDHKGVKFAVVASLRALGFWNSEWERDVFVEL